MKRLNRIFGRFNTIEKLYIIFFVLSILSGTIFGWYFDIHKLTDCDITGSSSVPAIFVHNTKIALTNIITGGGYNFIALFNTFSFISKCIYVNTTERMVFGVVGAMVVFGWLELFGFICFGLSGLGIYEKTFLRKNIRLKIKNLFLLGIVSLLISAIIEYFLIMSY